MGNDPNIKGLKPNSPENSGFLRGFFDPDIRIQYIYSESLDTSLELVKIKAARQMVESFFERDDVKNLEYEHTKDGDIKISIEKRGLSSKSREKLLSTISKVNNLFRKGGKHN